MTEEWPILMQQMYGKKKQSTPVKSEEDHKKEKLKGFYENLLNKKTGAQRSSVARNDQLGGLERRSTLTGSAMDVANNMTAGGGGSKNIDMI